MLSPATEGVMRKRKESTAGESCDFGQVTLTYYVHESFIYLCSDEK